MEKSGGGQPSGPSLTDPNYYDRTSLLQRQASQDAQVQVREDRKEIRRVGAVSGNQVWRPIFFPPGPSGQARQSGLGGDPLSRPEKEGRREMGKAFWQAKRSLFQHFSFLMAENTGAKEGGFEGPRANAASIRRSGGPDRVRRGWLIILLVPMDRHVGTRS